MVADFNKKQKREFFTEELLFKTLGIAFLILVAFLIFWDYKIYNKKRELTAQVESYKKQIKDIENSSQTLKEQIANSDNKDYLEKIAYEQLGQQKPGEKEVIFIAPEKKAPAIIKQQNFWSNFSAWLKSKL